MQMYRVVPQTKRENRDTGVVRLGSQ